MYTENNDIRTPRDRVDEDDLARFLLTRSERGVREETRDRRESCACGTGAQNARSSCPLCERSQGRNERSGGCSLCERGQGRNTRGRDADCDNYFVTLGAPLANVYTPLQIWREIYCETQAMERGTLFAELDKPFEGRGRKCR